MGQPNFKALFCSAKPLSAWLLIALFSYSAALLALPQSLLQTLTLEEREWLAAHPVIPYASDPAFPPIEFLNEEGALVGLAPDYLAYIGEQLDVTFKPLITQNWADSVTLVRSGKAYLLSAELITPENREIYQFSEPYTQFPMVILAREGVVTQQKIDDLSGKKVAVVTSYPDYAILKERFPEIHLVEVDDVVTGLRLTAFGQADAMVVYQPVASYYLEKEGIANLQVVGVAEFYTGTSFAVNKEHALLAEILSKALVAMPDSEKQKLIDRWILLKTELHFDYAPLIRLYAGAGILIFLLLGWVLQSQYQKKRLEQEIGQREEKDRELNQVMGALQEANRQLEIAVVTDPLTGALNRRGFYDLMSTEQSRVERYGGHFSLLILDVDHFKAVNDQYGHAAGDKVLKRITEICQELVRTIDVVCRLGGEEFAILLPNTDIQNAFILAQRIRQSTEQTSFQINANTHIRLSVSIGVSAHERGDLPDDLLAKADKALYFAKDNGRNLVARYPMDTDASDLYSI